MALVIDATAGGTSSNSYCTLAEAETYFESRLHKSTWDAATDETKNAALVWARRLLDEQIQWVGTKYESTQALRWPRYSVVDRDGDLIDSGTVPQFLKDAQAEFAAFLIAKDRTTEPSTFGFKKIGIEKEDILLEIDTANQRKPVIPNIVWDMISYYGVKASAVPRILERV